MAGSPSSSSITNDGYEYDVFLSFRGPDTRRDFTGNIWNALHNRGIRTFRDDLEIYKGNNIEKSLYEAIEKSKAAIIVLSPSYATSSFCLDELCHILKCIKGRGRFVWPIFYEVEPSIVRWSEEGTYGEAMAKHKASNWYSEDKLQKWKNALKQVANLSGTVYKWKTGHGYEYMFINKIVRDVSRVIQPFSLSIPDYLVGLEAQKQDVLSLLNVESDDEVYMVGIHGIGGIGKTTLAQVVYNSIVNQFDGSCYLEDVRGNPGKQGLIHLQNILLSKIFGENKLTVTSVNEGIKELQVRLKQKKVLLLLDNVDKLDQLRAIVGEPGWFGRGSRVIITTRDTQVLRSHGVERTHEVKMLNKDEAYELLRWKTFESNEVSPSFEDVFNRALTYTSGLPLAIEIIGSHLFSKKQIEEWKSALDRYEKIPKQEIFEILKVSFDALVQDDKDVFLDIACFFKGYNLEEVEKILHVHYGDEKKDHINVLIEKSLIKLSESNALTLHDLIEDMGKEIVRLESPDQPGERSRLWFDKDIVEVLEENTGTSKIGIMMCSVSRNDIVVNWDGEAFKNMTKLRTLVIQRVSFSESPKHLPNSLRVLHLWKYPSECFPVDFYPKQLTICKLNSTFNCPQEVFFKKYFKNMTSLQFHYCNSLRSIPDLSGLQNLEDFSCSACHALLTIDDSIGKLGKLQILKVEYCSMLQTIPSLKLPSLEELNLKGLFRIESLSPMLDESLDKLKILSVLDCPNIETIPSLKLASLEELYLSELHSIKSLSPMLDESLDKLKILKVKSCKHLIYIPLLKLASLENLTLSDLSSIESLSPMLDESLDTLKILRVNHCPSLKYIPLLKLPSLEELDLSYLSCIESLSPVLDESLNKLKFLSVHNCTKIETIPPLKLASLKELVLSDLHSIKSLSPMLDESLDKLKILKVKSCKHLVYIPLLKLASLENLTLSDLSNIESLSPMLDESLDKLKIVSVNHCPSLKYIPLLKLPSLEELDLSYLSSIESLSPMLDESLNKLKILSVYNCPKIETIPPLKLCSLEVLILYYLSRIESLSPMLYESMDKLKILKVHLCSALIYIPHLKLPSLEELVLSDLNSLKSLSPMLDESLDKLKILMVYRCSDLVYIPLLKLPSLEELDLSDLHSIKSLSTTLDEPLHKLKILKVGCYANLQTIPTLKLASLEELYLSELHSIKSLSPLLDESLLDKLKILSVCYCPKIETIPPLKIASLEKLSLKGLSSIESLSATLDESLVKLKILKVGYCPNLQTIPTLKLDSLKELYLSYLRSIKSLSPLLDESLDKLKVLKIKGCYKLWSFPPVMLPSLEKLDLSYCKCLESFPRITSRSMAKLKILRLTDCKKLRKIPAINVASLDVFDHSGCESLEFSTSY